MNTPAPTMAEQYRQLLTLKQLPVYDDISSEHFGQPVAPVLFDCNDRIVDGGFHHPIKTSDIKHTVFVPARQMPDIVNVDAVGNDVVFVIAYVDCPNPHCTTEYGRVSLMLGHISGVVANYPFCLN